MKFVSKYFISLIMFCTFPLLGNEIQLTLLKTFKGAHCPKAVEVSPNGKYVAVMNLEGLDFWLIDTQTLEIFRKCKFDATPAKGWDYKRKKPISSYAQKPVEGDFTPDSKYLWVSLHNASAAIVYNIEKNEILAEGELQEKLKVTEYFTNSKGIMTNKIIKTAVKKISTGKTPKVIKVTPDQKYVIVTDWHSSSVTIIDNQTQKKIKTIPVSKDWKVPRGLAITQDSKKAYIGNMGGSTYSVLDLETLTIVEEFAAGLKPRHIVLSKKNENILYVTAYAEGMVVKYDLATRKNLGQAPVGVNLRTLCLSPDEKYVFAAGHDQGKVSVIETETMKVVREIKVGAPMGVAVTPDGKQLWVCSYQGQFVNVYNIEVTP